MSNDTYLVWSNEHSAWWGANQRGYTTHIDSAGRYPRAVAMEICKGANIGFMQDSGENPNEIPVLVQDALETMSARPWSRS